jgi:hypothetical protein
MWLQHCGVVLAPYWCFLVRQSGSHLDVCPRKKRKKSFFKTKHQEFLGIFFAIFHNVKEITMADSLKVHLEKENKVP